MVPRSPAAVIAVIFSLALLPSALAGPVEVFPLPVDIAGPSPEEFPVNPEGFCIYPWLPEPSIEPDCQSHSGRLCLEWYCIALPWCEGNVICGPETPLPIGPATNLIPEDVLRTCTNAQHAICVVALDDSAAWVESDLSAGVCVGKRGCTHTGSG